MLIFSLDTVYKEKINMKYSALFSGKYKKNISNRCLKILPSMLSINKSLMIYMYATWV